MEARIPKKIHYCWFGKNEIPTSVCKCIESWHKFCPDYQIICWNEDNYDIAKNKYMQQAYEARKWAFVSDYARLDILYQEGGIYFDTDVEVIKNLDDLLYNELFTGFESNKINIGIGIGIGAAKYNIHIKNLRDKYNELNFINDDGSYNLTPIPQYTTAYFSELGLIPNGKTQELAGSKIYAPEYFCPFNPLTEAYKITPNTYSIHHYDASWWGDSEQKQYNKEKSVYKKFGIWGWRIYKGYLTLCNDGSYALWQKIKNMRRNK